MTDLMLSIVIITNIIGFIPIFLYIAKKKTFSEEVEHLVPFMWLVAFSSLYELVFTLAFRISNQIWFRFYVAIEFLVLYFFFKSIFQNRYKYYRNVFLLIFVTLFIGLAQVWKPADNLSTDSILSAVEFLFVIGLAISWFKEIFVNVAVNSLWHSPIFYFITGLLLYFSGTLFLFLLSDVILQNPALALSDYWLLNVVLTLIFRLLLILSIWKSQRR